MQLRSRAWRDGELIASDFDLSELDGYLADASVLTWLDVCDPHGSAIAQLAEERGATTVSRAIHTDNVDDFLRQLAELAEHASAVRDSPTINLRAYASDADYWADDARAREAGLPSALHRTATAHAAYLVREEFSIHAAIIPHRS